MEIFEIYCVQEEGNNCAKLFLKRSKMAPDVHVYWSQQIHVSHNFGLGQPGGPHCASLDSPTSQQPGSINIRPFTHGSPGAGCLISHSCSLTLCDAHLVCAHGG